MADAPILVQDNPAGEKLIDPAGEKLDDPAGEKLVGPAGEKKEPGMFRKAFQIFWFGFLIVSIILAIVGIISYGISFATKDKGAKKVTLEMFAYGLFGIGFWFYITFKFSGKIMV